VVLGNLDWITDSIYVANKFFLFTYSKALCIFFILLQPLVYFVGYLIYICKHAEFQIIEGEEGDSEETKELKLSDRA
jgi:hypothetical protein